jgi:hypothetical protein
MGNCCGGLESATRPGAFKGTGQRLGAANDEAPTVATGSGEKKHQDDLPKPRSDPNLSGTDREKQRAERIAAAEARQKQQGGPPKKKKKEKAGAPLNGPNSQPLMRW